MFGMFGCAILRSTKSAGDCSEGTTSDGRNNSIVSVITHKASVHNEAPTHKASTHKASTNNIIVNSKIQNPIIQNFKRQKSTKSMYNKAFIYRNTSYVSNFGSNEPIASVSPRASG